MRTVAILHICLLLVLPASVAQTRKANKHYGKALKYKAAKKPERAYRSMTKSLSKDPKLAEGYSQLGQWYFEAHRFAEAADLFRKASHECQNGAMQFAKPYARTLLYAGQAEKAISIINTYGTIRDSAEWNAMRAQAEFVRLNRGKNVCPTPLPIGFGERINTAVPELFPSMAVDTDVLYFTRRCRNEDDDFFKVLKDTCAEWYATTNIGYPASTPHQESAQFISADGHYLFLTRSDNRPEDGWTHGGADLYMAYRVAPDSPWTIPKPFGYTINTLDYEGMPALSPDTREMYFVSDRKGGYGGYDIWVSVFENGLWQLPVNAGPSINTAGDEVAPYINLDNKTLFFTSNGWTGFGGTDLFVSRRNTDGSWTKAENMGYPINTAFDEKSACVTLDGNKIYFASDRNGPAGNYDIFEAWVPYHGRPEPVSYIAGYVYDSVSKQRLTSASLHICDAIKGDTIYEFRSNRGDASFIITLPLDRRYIVHTAHMGHRPVSDTVSFSRQHLQKPLAHNVAMLPDDWDDIKTITDTPIAIVHFDANITELSESDRDVLRRSFQPWLQNKNYVITINSYTDNSGNPMLNEELSASRAVTVSREVGAIMSANNVTLVAKGWGEANPVASNDTEEGRKANRRVEISIRR